MGKRHGEQNAMREATAAIMEQMSARPEWEPDKIAANSKFTDILTEEDQERIETGLYVIVDQIAERCGPITEAVNDAVATRQVQQIDYVMAHPGDFVLYHVGYRCIDGSLLGVPAREINYRGNLNAQ